jgi:hypothetical protein
MVIVNLQATPYDRRSTIKINARCDDVMRSLMAHLNIEIKEWSYGYDYQFVAREDEKDPSKWNVSVEHCRFNEPCTFVAEVTVECNGKAKNLEYTGGKFVEVIDAKPGDELHVTIEWKEGYHQPPLTFAMKLDQNPQLLKDTFYHRFTY